MRNEISSLVCHWALLVLVAGCNTNDSGTDLRGQVCDPADAPAVEIALHDVLHVGADGQATLYALERSAEGDYRFFVSGEDVLVRREVLGRGEVAIDGGGDLLMITFEDGTVPSTFYAEEKPGGEVALALLRNAELRDKRSIPAEAEALERKNLAVVSSMKAVNLPSSHAVEYVARRETGELFYIDRPTHDFEYEDYRLFYGTASRMEQLRVTNIVRFLDGGSTYVDFELGGKDGYLMFCTPMLEDAPYVLWLDGQDERLTRLEAQGNVLAEMEFICHEVDASFQPPMEHSLTVEETCK